MYISYGSSLYNAVDLKRIAKLFVDNLPDGVTCLLSSGSSGCALATAIMMRSKRPLRHIFVRKEQENAHQPDYAGDLRCRIADREADVYAIVDDLIDTGKTIKRIVGWAIGHGIDKKNIKYIIAGPGATPEAIKDIPVRILG